MKLVRSEFDNIKSKTLTISFSCEEEAYRWLPECPLRHAPAPLVDPFACYKVHQ